MSAVRQRLRRPERRAQILAAATVAFARHGGYVATGLDDVAQEAGVTRMILYRHFDSKEEIYRAVLDHAGRELYAATTDADGQLTDDTWDALTVWARANPDAFRLLFYFAIREPDFRRHVDELRDGMRSAVHNLLHAEAAASPLTNWAANLATAVAIEGILAWFDAGRPDPDRMSNRLRDAVEATMNAVTR